MLADKQETGLDKLDDGSPETQLWRRSHAADVDWLMEIAKRTWQGAGYPQSMLFEDKEVGYTVTVEIRKRP